MISHTVRLFDHASRLVHSPASYRCIEMREESARRHEQLQQMLLSSASARESVSFSDPGSVQ